MDRKDKLEIYEGRPAILQLVMGSLAFFLALLFLTIFFSGYNLLRPEFRYQTFDAGSLYTAIIMTGLGVVLSKNNSIVLDRKEKRLQRRWHIGPISFGKWERLPIVAYISVFKAHKTYSVNFDTRAPIRYEVNLWMKKGGRKRIYFSYDDQVALQMGIEIARFLKVDLWDATDPHNKTKITYNKL